ncbi:MAG TPA: CusA/CzcA family heavy metal efflux RND transporter, partial [Thermodesulfobacteriota bacterium]|nr:CusA/CzcA family heavy metal efflux RND transporter [Thermodesulfobacteriota bacterium]
RRLVMERMAEARERIPRGVGTMEMGPNTTGLGEVFQYYLKPLDGEFSAMDLRSRQDWSVRLILRTAPGVDDVLSFGGEERQFQIRMMPEKLIKYGLPLSEVLAKVADGNKSVGGQFIVKEREEYLVRGRGWAQSTEDLKRIVLKAEKGTPVYLRDVAEIAEGPAPRRGAVTLNGKEIVIGVALKRTGENTRQVIDNLKARSEIVKQALPPGIRMEPFYDQSELVEKAVSTVGWALLEGGVLVSLVLFLFLGEIRTAVVVVSSIPISMLVAFLLMEATGMSANLMSLGGLTIAIGMIVDGAVVMAENSFRFLSSRRPGGGEREAVILEACAEVAKPVTFALLINIISLLPIFALFGLEGKLFRPMVLTKSFGMTAALLLSLTAIPALSTLLLRGREKRESFLFASLRSVYGRALDFTLERGRTVIAGALVLFAASLLLLPFLGTEFVPALEEGSVQIRITNIPSASLEESVRVAKKTEEILLRMPEVSFALSKSGRAEKTCAEDVNNIETYVALKPMAGWRKGVSKQGLVNDMRKELEAAVPTALFNFSQPIQMRVDELVSGTRAALAVKIHGEELAVLGRLGEEVKEVISSVRGAKDVQAEMLVGKPTVTVQVNREAAARFGLNAANVLETIHAGVGGEEVTTVIDGNRRVPVVVRFDERSRSDVADIMNIPVRTPDGSLIPVSRVAEAATTSGIAQIRRENLSRLIAVYANVEDRDIGGFVAEAQRKMKSLKFPPGYYVTWGGQFEHQQKAMRTLAVIIPITVLLILVLLYTEFKSLRLALLIMTGVPLSIIGGVFSLFLSGQNLSVPAAVGFLAVFGVAMLNGVVLVAYFCQLRSRGKGLDEAVREGCLLRLRPILITATVAILGLLPLLVARGVGAEVQRPLSTVVVGGLFTSTLLTLFVLPAIYLSMEKRWGRAGGNC